MIGRIVKRCIPKIPESPNHSIGYSGYKSPEGYLYILQIRKWFRWKDEYPFSSIEKMGDYVEARKIKLIGVEIWTTEELKQPIPEAKYTSYRGLN